MIADIHQESVARVILGTEAIGLSGSSLTDASKLEAEKIQKARESGTDAALHLAGEILDDNAATQAREKQFGTRKPDGTIDRTNNDTAKRFKETGDIQETVSLFLKEGYSRLSGTQQNQIRASIETIILQIPALRDVYQATTDNNIREAMIKSIALNPAYSRIVADVARGVFDPTKIPAETISALEIEIKGLETRLAEIGTKLVDNSDLNTRIKSLQEELDILEGRVTSRRRIASIDSQKADLEIISNDIQSVEERRQDLSEYLRSLKSARNTDSLEITKPGGQKETFTDSNELDKKIKDIEKQYKEADKNYRELAAKKSRLERIIQRQEEGNYEADLKRQLQELQQQREALQRELADIQTRLAQKKIDLATATSEREYAEIQFTAKVKGIFSEAARTFLEQEISSISQTQKAILEKEAAEEFDLIKKKAKEHMARRWLDGQLNFQKIQIDSDYGDLLAEAGEEEIGGQKLFVSGPERVLVKILKDAKISDDKILQLMKDKSFTDEFVPKVAQKVITMKMLTGGISLKDAHAIALSDWGPDMLAKAIQGKQEIQKQIDEAIGAGAIDWKGNVSYQFKKFFEGAGKLTSRYILIILAILIGLGLFAVFRPK